MTNHWHEQVQRYIAGQSSAEEAAALHEALNRDADLRALYLDYMNLDAALGALANEAAGTQRRPQEPAAVPASQTGPRSHPWRWLAPMAACGALVLFGVLSWPRGHAPARPTIGAATVSAFTSISRLHADIPPAIPAWMSPTGSLLKD